jgi:flagellar biosynthesis protein FliQ
LTESYILSLAQKTLLVVLQVSMPILGLSLVIGLVVSIFQAVTQIQDVTLAFVPKILAVGIAIIVFGPWMLREIVAFTHGLFVSLPLFAR